ncbi:MAG: hypothetical protein KDH92_05330, partial [Chloroflexi bacterium]|nr:hypothetical protein [Chloroflexota bacterium]
MSATPDPAQPNGAGSAADASGSIAPVALREPAETAVPTDGRVERRPDPPAACLPFGPYAGQTVAAVAVMDPDYLLALVREGIGPAELRAEAARALALRERLPQPSGWGGPGAAADRPVQPGGAIARGSGSGAWPAHPGSTRAAGSSLSAWGLGAAIGLLLLLAGVGHGDRLGR